MSSSPQQPVNTLPTLPDQPFRLDVPLHDLLQKGQEPSKSNDNGPKLLENRVPLALPTPVFPQHPELTVPDDGDPLKHPPEENSHRKGA